MDYWFDVARAVQEGGYLVSSLLSSMQVAVALVMLTRHRPHYLLIRFAGAVAWLGYLTYNAFYNLPSWLDDIRGPATAVVGIAAATGLIIILIAEKLIPAVRGRNHKLGD